MMQEQIKKRKDSTEKEPQAEYYLRSEVPKLFFQISLCVVWPFGYSKI